MLIGGAVCPIWLQQLNSNSATQVLSLTLLPPSQASRALFVRPSRPSHSLQLISSPNSRPYCGHCKSFAPTWRDLVDTLGPTSAASNFHFAQVDCAANGDLCQAHGVKYYPSIFLYVAGEKFDEFDGKRTLSALSQYVADNMPAASSSSSEEEEGEGETGTGSKTVLRLADDDLDEPTALEILLGPNSAERPPVTVAPAVEKLIKVVKQEVVVEEKEEVEEEETTPALVASSRPTPPGAPPAFVAQPRGDEKRGADVGSQVVEKADGTVRVLFGDDLLAVKAKGAGPAFVKFYAPWYVSHSLPCWGPGGEEES